MTGKGSPAGGRRACAPASPPWPQAHQLIEHCDAALYNLL